MIVIVMILNYLSKVIDGKLQILNVGLSTSFYNFEGNFESILGKL